MEKMKLMTDYDDLKNEFIEKVQKDKILSSDYSFIHKAVLFGESKHKNQKAKYDQGLYFRHCLRVASNLLSESDRDKDLIVGALLHDIVEDTDTTLAEIKEIFGDGVELFVKGMTKAPTEYKEKWGENRYYNEGFFGPLKEASKKDKRIWKIKLSDRSDNLSNYYLWAPYEKLANYTWESEQFINFTKENNVKTVLIDIVLKQITIYHNLIKNGKR